MPEPQMTPTRSRLMLVSNSPEAPTQSGVLYQDTVSGNARVLAYHLNALNRPARLYMVARNTESRALDVTTLRSGETAPTRIESVLGALSQAYDIVVVNLGEAADETPMYLAAG